MSKRPFDLLIRNRYGYSNGLPLAGTFGSVDGAVRGAIKRLQAEIDAGRPGLAFDYVFVITDHAQQDRTYVGYPEPTGPSPRETVQWSPRETADAIAAGHVKPGRLRPKNGDAYCPDGWELAP